METVSGDISIPFDFSFSSSNIVTTSGDILFEARTDGGLSVKNTSGNVNLKNSVDGKIEIINVSGNVSYENMFASDIYIQTTSGDIYISSSNVLETADVYQIAEK